ncbi:MAG: iron-containing alcohol dehydrogenase, partial [Candidatus Diapherotrites archaeon]
AYHNLEKAVFYPDKLARHNMAFASLEAAKAFSQTGTTAPHTISRPFTKYYGLTHGFAVACTIPWFLDFYYDAMPDRIIELCNIIGAKSVEEAQNKITALIKSVGGKTRLRDFGVKVNDFNKIVSESMMQKPQNPKKHTKQDIMRLLGELY